MLFSSDNIGEEEGHGSATHCVEKIEAQRSTVKQPPRFVGDECLQVLSQRGSAHGSELLAGKTEAQEEQYETA